LGKFFEAAAYPRTRIGMLGIGMDFPSVGPPDYLRQLSPDLYEQECRRVQSRFDEAVELAEQAFLDELTRLVDHLGDRPLDGLVALVEQVRDQLRIAIDAEHELC